MASREEIEIFLRMHLPDLKLNNTGRNGMAKCPFHADDNPSLSVDLDKELWNCFAGCGGGNLSSLARRLGIPDLEVPLSGKGHRQKPLPPMVVADMLRVQDHYVATPINFSGTGERLLIYRDGVFRPNGEEIARTKAQAILGDELTPFRLETIIGCLKESSKVAFEDLNLEASDRINVLGGMLDWRRGRLFRHSEGYLSTLQINAKFAPDVSSSIVDSFLREVLHEDSIALLEEYLGYCLIPDTSLQKAMVVLGEGSNGKSTLIGMATALFGRENVSHISLHDMVRNRYRAAEMHGRLINVYADLPRSTLDETEIFKMVVSGDELTAERKWGHPFKFKPFARMLFSANRLPPTKDDSAAFFRRLLILPCDRKFEGGAADPRLLERLTTPLARSALLFRAVQGLRRLKDRGHFVTPSRSQVVLDDYRAGVDEVFEFLTKALEKSNDGTVEKEELYRRYKKGRPFSNSPPVRQHDFNKRVVDIFGAVEAKVGTRRAWRGLRWKTT